MSYIFTFLRAIPFWMDVFLHQNELTWNLYFFIFKYVVSFISQIINARVFLWLQEINLQVILLVPVQCSHISLLQLQVKFKICIVVNWLQSYIYYTKKILLNCIIPFCKTLSLHFEHKSYTTFFSRFTVLFGIRSISNWIMT